MSSLPRIIAEMEDEEGEREGDVGGSPTLSTGTSTPRPSSGGRITSTPSLSSSEAANSPIASSPTWATAAVRSPSLAAAIRKLALPPSSRRVGTAAAVERGASPVIVIVAVAVLPLPPSLPPALLSLPFPLSPPPPPLPSSPAAAEAATAL